MQRQGRWFLLAVLLIVIVGLNSCGGDHCVDVACGPVPLPLEVTVSDTMGIDTTLQVMRNGGVVLLDTVLIVHREVSDATVRLLRVSGTDTTAFDTLAPSGTAYIRSELAGLDDGPFLIVATRGMRGDTVRDVKVRKVEGCCPYAVVGRFAMNIRDVIR